MNTDTGGGAAVTVPSAVPSRAAVEGSDDEGSEEVVVGKTVSNEKDTEDERPRFLRREDVGDAMSEESEEAPAMTNICTDSAGNEYLKIYDIDSGREMYEVIERNGGLETVAESDEEDVEEDDSEEGGGEAKEDGNLSNESCSKNYAHQDVPRAPPNVGAGLELRKVKSSKKKHIHTRKRAIAKSKARKLKYDLVNQYEKGPSNSRGIFRDRASSESSQPLLSLDTSSHSTDICAPQKSGATRAPQKDDTARGNQRIMSPLSIDSFASIVIQEERDNDVFAESADDLNAERSCPSRSEAKANTGQSMVVTKLYSDNMELAESLAETKSKLEKVIRELDMAKKELSTKQFEM